MVRYDLLIETILNDHLETVKKLLIALMMKTTVFLCLVALTCSLVSRYNFNLSCFFCFFFEVLDFSCANVMLLSKLKENTDNSLDGAVCQAPSFAK